MTAGRPFSLYRIIRSPDNFALVSGSNWPHGHIPSCTPWWRRGTWTRKGNFWRTENGVKLNLWQLCHDWRSCSRIHYGARGSWHEHWHERLTENPDWSRLELLRVEETIVKDATVSETCAKEFLDRQGRCIERGLA